MTIGLLADVDEMNSSVENRFSRLEGGYEHVAKKADTEALRGELKAGFQAVRSDMTKLLLMGLLAQATLVIGVLKFLP